MERNRIIVKVKLRLDELGPFEEGQVVDSGRIDHYLDDCVKRLLLIVPPHMCKPTSFAGETPVPFTDNKSGYIPLPDAFVRFVALKMHSWSRTVNNAITELNPLYRRQSSPYIRGSNDKPVVVFRHEPALVTAFSPKTLGKCLEYYSVLTGDHVITRGLYLASCVAELLDDNLVDPLSWLVAETILSAVGETDLAKSANAKVGEWIMSASTV
jgi:hypothetical protein